MSYNSELADRMWDIVSGRKGVTDKYMFGSVALLVDGKMFAGVSDDMIMVRIGKEAYEATLEEPHVMPMDFTGKPLTGYVYVLPEGIMRDDQLSAWLERGLKYTRTLPAKKPKKPKKKKKTATKSSTKKK